MAYAFTANTFLANTNSSSGSTASGTIVTSTTNLTAGNLVVVMIQLSDDTTLLTGVTDTAGTAYTVLATPSPSNAIGGRWWCAYGIAAARTGNNYIFAAMNATVTNGFIASAGEFTGNPASSYFGGTNQGSGAASLPSVSLNSVTSGSLIIGVATSSNGSHAFSAGSGAAYSLDYGNASVGAGSANSAALEHILSGPAGTVVVDFTGGSASGTWTAMAVAFNPASTPTPVTGRMIFQLP